MVLGCKRLHKPGRTFPDFYGLSYIYLCLKSNLHPCPKISAMAILPSKSSIELGAGFEYLFIASYFLLVSAEALIYDAF